MSNHDRRHIAHLDLENSAFLIWGDNDDIIPEIDLEAGRIHCKTDFAYFLPNVAIGEVLFHVSVGTEPADWAYMKWLREATFTTRMWGLLRLRTAAMSGDRTKTDKDLWTIDDGMYTLTMRHYFNPDDGDCVARERPERMWTHLTPAEG